MVLLPIYLKRRSKNYYRPSSGRRRRNRIDFTKGYPTHTYYIEVYFFNAKNDEKERSSKNNHGLRFNKYMHDNL